jgi:hypothetical protein
MLPLLFFPSGSIYTGNSILPSGLEAVYRARDLGSDRTFTANLAMLNGNDLPLGALQVIAACEHGIAVLVRMYPPNR